MIKKLNHLVTFKKLVKDLKIANIHIKDTLVDYKTIDNYSIADLEELVNSNELYIAKKYIPLLVQNGIDLDLAVLFLDKVGTVYLIRNNKFIEFNVTHHSTEQLIKRMIYIYINSNEYFEINKSLHKIYLEHFNYLVQVFLSNDYKDIGNDVVLHDIIKALLKDSDYHDSESASKLRDKKAFRYRDRKYKNTNRYYSFPFLFIIEDSLLKTVELYFGDNGDARAINKLTSGNCTELLKEMLHEGVGL